MNMEIKFKAKRKDNDEWAFGNYSKHIHYDKLSPTKNVLFVAHNIDHIEDDKLFNGIYQSVVIKPETVCQFTGFVTKISKQEVYRGDRVLVKGSHRKGIYETEVIWERFGFTLKENSTKLIDSACLMCVIEVIGNIYDQTND